jgi:hypothetical protein
MPVSPPAPTPKTLVDLAPGEKPTLIMTAVDADPNLTEFQRRALHALAWCSDGYATAETIAGRLGYRPASSGRLAVTSALRPLLDPESREGASGKYIYRTAPQDRWGSARWGLFRQFKAFEDPQGRPCRYEYLGALGKCAWVLLDPPAPAVATPAPRPRAPGLGKRSP